MGVVDSAALVVVTVGLPQLAKECKRSLGQKSAPQSSTFVIASLSLNEWSNLAPYSSLEAVD